MSRDVSAPRRAASLRLRLFVLILAPLIVMAAAVGLWRYRAAEATAGEAFDRALVAVTLAIARDVAVSGGDAVSASTRDLIAGALDGAVFYHVYGPDGGFVTGYATPPPPPAAMAAEMRAQGGPRLFDSVYRGEPVRAARLVETAEIDGLSGLVSVTVWHETAARGALADRVAANAALVIGALLAGAAIVVWFGVRLGLRPLLALEAAIARRSPADLSPIRRPTPPEITGVVGALNRLFDQAENALATRDAFISDAAHQLRNPVAGVLALAEAARDAPSDAARADRVAELVDAARHAGRVTGQFLTYERAKGGVAEARLRSIDLVELARDAAARAAPRLLGRAVDMAFELDPGLDVAIVRGEPVLLAAALENLIDNALTHAGPTLRTVEVRVAAEPGRFALSVADDGAGLSEAAAAAAFERYQQWGGGAGSGLGLAIVREIARRHGGEARIERRAPGACVSIILPRPVEKERSR